MRYEKIIMVSKDGTYRAPASAAVMRKQIGMKAKVEARGLVVLLPEPVNPKGVATAISRGYHPTEAVSKLLTEEDFAIDTLILVMTERLKQQIYDTFKNALNVYTLKEFAGAQGDIDTPFGKNMEEYMENFEQLEEWVNKAAELLNENKKIQNGGRI